MNLTLTSGDETDKEIIKKRIRIFKTMKEISNITMFNVDDEVEMLNFLKSFQFESKDKFLEVYKKTKPELLRRPELLGKLINNSEFNYTIADIGARFLILLQTSKNNNILPLNYNIIGYPLINNELFLINKFKNLIFCGWAGYDRQEKLSRNWFQYDDAAAPFVSDNFAFGSSEAMDVYSNTYNVLLNFKNFYSGGDNVSGFIPGPEICLGTNLLLEKINFLRTTFKYKTLTGFDDKNLFFSNYYGHTDNSILKI
jgi:hypothetical protein